MHQDSRDVDRAVLDDDAAHLLEQALRLGEARDRLVRLTERRVQIREAHDLALGGLALAHVAHQRLHRGLAFEREVARGHFDVHREPVLAQVRHLHARHRGVRVQLLFEVTRGLLAELRMHDLEDVLAEQPDRFFRSEQARGRRVGEHHPVVAEDQDRVGRQIDELAIAVLGLLAHHELADLAPDPFRRLGDGEIGLPHLAREELHRAEQAAADHDGKGERTVEPGREGGLAAHDIFVRSHVEDPVGLARLQHPAQEPLGPGHEALAARDLQEGAALEVRAAPHLGALEGLVELTVRPTRAVVPIHDAADRADDLRHHLLDAHRIGELPHHRVLDRLALLRLLALGDVLADAAIAAKDALLVEHRLAAHAHPAQLAVAAGSQVLEVVERTVRRELRPMALPLRLAHPERGELPARAAHVVGRAQVRLVGEAGVVGEAEVLVLLPVPVGGQAQQAAEAALQPLVRRVGVRAGIPVCSNVLAQLVHERGSVPLDGASGTSPASATDAHRSSGTRLSAPPATPRRTEIAPRDAW